MKVFYSDDYAGAEHAFETTRKARWIAESLRARPLGGVELALPPPLDEALLRAVHDPAYVEAVRTGEPRDLACGQGFSWDPRLWDMVCASNGGVVAAAREALVAGVSGSLSSGLHHARRAEGHGFCTFNGLALATRAALSWTDGAILVLDLDAHCGGGTWSLLRDDPRVWQLDVSVSPFDGYPPSDRFTLDVVERAEGYLSLVESRLDEVAARAPRFGLCLYNAGMDPFEKDPSGLARLDRGVLERRERTVFSWCRERSIPVAFVLAGGYLRENAGHDQTSLVDLHRLTLAAASYHDWISGHLPGAFEHPGMRALVELLLAERRAARARPWHSYGRLLLRDDDAPGMVVIAPRASGFAVTSLGVRGETRVSSDREALDLGLARLDDLRRRPADPLEATARFDFATDARGREFCVEIARTMSSLYGIAEEESLARLNAAWRDRGVVDEHSIVFHETEDYWASAIYHGKRDFWRHPPGSLQPEPLP